MRAFRRYLRFLLVPGVSISLACAALAGEPADLKAKVDALAQPLVDSGGIVGLAVGIVQDGKTHVFGYGKISKTSDKRPDGKTVFEIGSIIKVFTGLLLADMAERKLVKLDDPVARYLPQSVTVPQKNERPITLLDLATHTSGLPRLPGNLLPQIALHPGNPYAKYTVEQLYEFLSKHALAHEPGAHFTYSNLGMGLLGHALARKAGTTYEELLQQRICVPLGMKDTRIELSKDVQQRLAEGHNLAGKPVANWDIPTLAGAGALRSTADALLLLLAANLGPRRTPLAEAVELSHIARRDAGGADQKIALGWHIRAKESIYWHNGETGGYHSYLAFRKGSGSGVVVLSNSANGVIDQLGSKLLKAIDGQPVDTPPPAAGRVTACVLDAENCQVYRVQQGAATLVAGIEDLPVELRKNVHDWHVGGSHITPDGWFYWMPGGGRERRDANAITYIITTNRVALEGTRFVEPKCSVLATTTRADQAVANPALIAGPNGQVLLLYEHDESVDRQLIAARILRQEQ